MVRVFNKNTGELLLKYKSLTGAIHLKYKFYLIDKKHFKLFENIDATNLGKSRFLEKIDHLHLNNLRQKQFSSREFIRNHCACSLFKK